VATTPQYNGNRLEMHVEDYGGDLKSRE